jgi:hypothetical protein
MQRPSCDWRHRTHKSIYGRFPYSARRRLFPAFTCTQCTPRMPASAVASPRGGPLNAPKRSAYLLASRPQAAGARDPRGPRCPPDCLRLAGLSPPLLPAATGGGPRSRLGQAARDYNPRSESPGWSTGRGPSGHRNFRSSSRIATSLVEASRRRMSPPSSNSHCSLP